MGHLRGDIVGAVRGWRHNLGLTSAAVLAIALGIAANTTIFSFVSAVLLRPLPYGDPGRIVVVWQDFRAISGREREWTSPGLFLEWQRRSSDALDAIAVVRGWAPTLTGTDTPERLQGAAVSAAYFDVLGVAAHRGRLLSAADDTPGAATVAVISHGLWVRRFGQDPGVVGRVLQLDQQPVTVVGVLPAEFEPALIPAEIWSATRIPPGAPTGMVVLQSVARLRQDVALDLARDRMSTVARSLDQEGIAESGAGILLEPLQDYVTGDVRLPLLVLSAAVAAVLLIACLNVTLLLLARAAVRAREVSLRAALGASRSRIVRQLLTETAVLAVAGASLGLLLTVLSIDSIRALAPATVPRLGDVRVDTGVITLAVLLTVAATFVSGLLPAVLGSRSDLNALLRETTGAPRVVRLNQWVVIVEVAVAVTLLSAAGQILRSFDRLQRVDLGFSPAGVVTSAITLPRARYQTDESVRAFYDRVLARLDAAPDIERAGLVSVLPLSGSDTDISFAIEGRPAPSTRAEEPTTWVRLVSADYFATMGIALHQGRVFTETDNATAPCVVVVNRALAQRYWPDGSARGARVIAMAGSCEVVGIVANVHHRGPAVAPEPEMYFSLQQRIGRGVSIVARATSAAATDRAGSTVTGVIRSEDPAIPPGTLRTLDAMLGRTLAQPRFVSTLVATFAGVAFVLALIGVYGLLSYGVSRRTREIGLRMAIGADTTAVARLVAIGSAWTLVAGLAVGIAGALAASRSLGALLFEIEPGDPATLAAVAVLVMVAGAGATLVPLWRATRVDPVSALRQD